ncbi:hypothetical protein GCM10010988_12830 [Cnuibacter physcomitrellae]|nr:DUF2510 domain-containing protein [Cnuibacter physcomitrellae]GGI37214.1 hypothetical protein GCM10010988_12830 [Cnuibacter physcomitrellae]
MGAAPGWYDAGTPGRLRWWDGTQWSEHERDAAAVAPAPTPASGQGAQTGPVMGWYQPASGPVRWWDGQKWTGMRFRKDGRPGVDWANSEQPGAAWAFAIIFLGLAVFQFVLGTLAQSVNFSGAGTMLLAILWLSIAITSSAVRRIPAPTGAPLVTDIVRPLPGEQEGPGAGWYQVASTTSRWWTGARWSQYVQSRFGVRPTFHGPRSYRVYVWLSWGMVVFGVLLLIVGIVLMSLGAGASDYGLTTVVGVVALLGGILFGVLGGVLLAFSPMQRRMLLVPAAPPAA